MSKIEIAAEGGSFSGYLALPSTTPAPGIVVAQEIFGVNQVMRDVCDWLAGAGFVAFCPDLFWRIEPGIELTDQSEAEWARAFELFGLFDLDAGMGDMQASIDWLRGHDAVSGKVGAVGYCLGGKVAYLSATRTSSDASVGYYGVGIEGLLEEAAKITKPLMLHIAEEDSFCPKEAQAAIKTALTMNPLVSIHSYPGREHAFARPGGEHYHADDAETANARSLDFFKEHLAP